MSFKAMTWAASVKTGSPTKKLILLLLADRANDEGECFPSLNRIAIDCEMSKRAVQNNIKALGSSGHIEIIHRRTEEVQLSNVYRLRTGGVPDGTGVENEVLGGRERSARGVGNEVPPNQSLESVIEPKRKKKDPLIAVLEELEPSRKEILEEWLSYKREKGQGYKKRGLEALIKTLEPYSDMVVRESVNLAMSSNWAGLFPEKVESKQPAKNPNKVTESPKW